MRNPSDFAPVDQGSCTTQPIGFHLTMRLADDRPLAISVAALRVIARAVLEQGDMRGLLAFGCADDHLHVELVTDRAAAGMFARYLQNALRRRLSLGARFARAHLEPLTGQKHTLNTFHYVQRQDARHALGRDPMREGTSLPDLLGLRVVRPSIIARVRAHVPRVGRQDLTKHFPPGVLDDDGGPVDPELLADAACAAFALRDLQGRGDDLARARHAAVRAAGAEVSNSFLSDCLGIGVRAIQYLRSEPTDAMAVSAVRKQALLRTAMSKLPQVT